MLRVRYAARKTERPPCVNPTCPDPTGGPVIGTGNVTPTRCSGARFGVDGVLCGLCWLHLKRRAETDARRAAGQLPVRRSVYDREPAAPVGVYGRGPRSRAGRAAAQSATR